MKICAKNPCFRVVGFDAPMYCNLIADRDVDISFPRNLEFVCFFNSVFTFEELLHIKVFVLLDFCNFKIVIIFLLSEKKYTLKIIEYTTYKNKINKNYRVIIFLYNSCDL